MCVCDVTFSDKLSLQAIANISVLALGCKEQRNQSACSCFSVRFVCRIELFLNHKREEEYLHPATPHVLKDPESLTGTVVVRKNVTQSHISVNLKPIIYRN